MLGTMTEKTPRPHERKRVSWDAKLHQDGRTWKCKAIDISPGGVKIYIDERLAVNSGVLLTIGRVGSFPGEVRWQAENLTGIRFLEDPDAVEERLRDASHTRD